MNKNQVKNRRTRECNEPQSSEISKVKDIQRTQIKLNIKRQVYPMNQVQVKYQTTGMCSERSNQ